MWQSAYNKLLDLESNAFSQRRDVALEEIDSLISLQAENIKHNLAVLEDHVEDAVQTLMTAALARATPSLAAKPERTREQGAKCSAENSEIAGVLFQGQVWTHCPNL